MNGKKGLLLVLSGPSGTGKSTVIAGLMGLRDDIRFSVSATTRAPRPGEQDGRDYYFISREEFLDMIGRDAFLEHAEYVGNFYGTPPRRWRRTCAPAFTCCWTSRSRARPR